MLQTSPNTVWAEYAMGARRINNVVLGRKRSPFVIVPVERVTVSISIQRSLYRVPAGVYSCIGHKVIVDPVGIRRVPSR